MGKKGQVKTIAAIKLAVFPSQKINISGTYEVSEDKTFLENPFSKVTTTTTLNLKTTPGKDTPDRPKFLPRYLRNLSGQYLTKRKNMATGALP
ncbi:hypothetical protein E3J84_01860 [Candidatus Aerophobetes bacterium]|uniref:Uncharacterized protein n=1 Tax=Aerophobetes bacterium TaxID=2030807 RepID=A0A523S343_UNCAE|nr:MAG: hypothetical protein E3J84_01860 [Candidatus Aerophobetes bacterium]